MSGPYIAPIARVAHKGQTSSNGATTYVRAFRQHASRLHVGIAGGLCAAEMPRVHDLVSRAGLSVDAEGALRDGDEGGTLNVERAKEYLKLAYQAQGHAS